MHIFMYIFIHVCTYTCLHIHVYIHRYLFIYVYTHVYIHTGNLLMSAVQSASGPELIVKVADFGLARVQDTVKTMTGVYICGYMYTYMYIYIYIHVHTFVLYRCTYVASVLDTVKTMTGVYTCGYMYVFMYIYSYLYTRVGIQCIYTHACSACARCRPIYYGCVFRPFSCVPYYLSVSQSYDEVAPDSRID